MLNSYLAIASRNGLERLCPEHPEATRFLSAQATRLRRERAVLVWAVLPTDAADDIMEELRFGEKQAALRLLQHTAREGGRLMTG
jgi:hypothetical protein